MDNIPYDIDYIVEWLSWCPYITLLWCGLIIGSLLVAMIPQLSCVSHHGKCSVTDSQRFFDKLTVPKSYFIHFYILGSVMTILMMIIHSNVFHFTNTIALFLFLFHNLRRCWECFFITEYGYSTMHITGYLCGMIHYFMYPITLELSIIDREVFKTKESTREIINNPIFYSIIGLFILANGLQYISHDILYRNKRKLLKKKDDDEDDDDQNSSLSTASNGDNIVPKIQYTIPTGWGFNYCCCPHYLAEILIYLSLLCLEHHTFMMFLTFIWVLSNLSVVAYQQYCWYLQYYVEEMEERKLTILFPFLW